MFYPITYYFATFLMQFYKILLIVSGNVRQTQKGISYSCRRVVFNHHDDRKRENYQL